MDSCLGLLLFGMFAVASLVTVYQPFDFHLPVLVIRNILDGHTSAPAFATPGRALCVRRLFGSFRFFVNVLFRISSAAKNKENDA